MKHQGKILKSEMEFRKVGQHEFGERMGVSRSTVQRYYSMPRLDGEVIDKACELYGIDESVFGDTPDCLTKLSKLQEEYIDLMKKSNEKDHRIHELELELSEFKSIAFMNEVRDKLGEYKQKKQSS